MKKLRYILPLLALLLFGCRSDEFSWNGHEVADDECVIAFRVADFKVEKTTRADDLPATKVKIEDLSLLVFSGNGELLSQNGLYKRVDLPLDESNGALGKIDGEVIATTVSRNDLASGRWYLVANFNQVLANNGLGEITNEEEFLNLELPDDQLLDDNSIGGKAPFLRSDVRVVNVADYDAEKAPDVFFIHRMYSKLSVMKSRDASGADLVPGLHIYGMQLYKRASQGLVGGAWEDEFLHYTNLILNDDESLNLPATGSQDDNSLIYMPYDGAIDTYTYPIKVNTAASDPKDTPLMVIKAAYKNEDDDSWSAPVYYAVKLSKDLKPGVNLQAIITDYQGVDQTSIEDAINNPGKISVEYKEVMPTVTNIMSDGENVLAVPDTVRVKAAATSFEIPVNYRTAKGQDALEPQMMRSDKAKADSWITGAPSLTISEGTQADNGQNLYTYGATFTLTCTANKGTQREDLVRVKLGDRLMADVVVIQLADENAKIQEKVKVSLKIEGNGDATDRTIDDYFAFIGIDGSASCQGILPAENGGRVRNNGLHIPMQDAEGNSVRYTYTIEPNENNLELYINSATGLRTLQDKSGGKWTFTFGYDSSKENEVQSGVLEFVDTSTGATYYLDKYFTGFFFDAGAGIGYYEVCRDSKGRRWLDRNIAASTAGMCNLGGSNGGGSWPFVGSAATGKYYDNVYSNGVVAPTKYCPKGFRMPTYLEFNAMTSSSAFVIGSQNGVFVPSMTYSSLEKTQSDKVGHKVTHRAYFPHSRLKQGDSLKGDPETGYFLTCTSAGEANYVQVIRMRGINVSTENIKVAGDAGSYYSMSIRCIDNSVETDAVTASDPFECGVVGFTHVFLYYDDGNGNVEYITQWPGEQIATADMVGDVTQYINTQQASRPGARKVAKRTSRATRAEFSNRVFRFSKANYTQYDPSDENIYVIFNYVNSAGQVVVSCVNESNRNNRKGIKFQQGGTYRINNPKPEDHPEQLGNWGDSSGPVDPPVETDKKTIAFRWLVGSEGTGNNVTIFDTSVQNWIVINRDACHWDVSNVQADKLSEDGKYRYTILKEGKTLDNVGAYSFTQGNNIKWADNKHVQVTVPDVVKTYTDANGNPVDELYTIWAVGDNEPTPPTQKKVVFRWKEDYTSLHIYKGDDSVITWYDSNATVATANAQGERILIYTLSEENYNKIKDLETTGYSYMFHTGPAQSDGSSFNDAGGVERMSESVRKSLCADADDGFDLALPTAKTKTIGFRYFPYDTNPYIRLRGKNSLKVTPDTEANPYIYGEAVDGGFLLYKWEDAKESFDVATDMDYFRINHTAHQYTFADNEGKYWRKVSDQALLSKYGVDELYDLRDVNTATGNAVIWSKKTVGIKEDTLLNKLYLFKNGSDLEGSAEWPGAAGKTSDYSDYFYLATDNSNLFLYTGTQPSKQNTIEFILTNGNVKTVDCWFYSTDGAVVDVADVAWCCGKSKVYRIDKLVDSSSTSSNTDFTSDTNVMFVWKKTTGLNGLNIWTSGSFWDANSDAVLYNFEEGEYYVKIATLKATQANDTKDGKASCQLITRQNGQSSGWYGKSIKSLDSSIFDACNNSSNNNTGKKAVIGFLIE